MLNGEQDYLVPKTQQCSFMDQLAHQKMTRKLISMTLAIGPSKKSND